MTCNCHEYYESPHYHAKDYPHSVEYKWDCAAHGHQERFHLIHETKQPYCKPCEGKILHYQVGTKVNKVKGYKFPGVVVAAFFTTAGEERYVVEMDGYGLLHIFNRDQLIGE